MPRVARYGERRITTDALPGVRKTSSASTFESEGGGIGKAIVGFGGVVADTANVFMQIAAQERQRADEVAELTWTRKLNTLDHSLLHDPETGILNKTGLEPQELREKYLETFDAESSKIAGALKTDRQRAAFEAQREQRRDRFRERAGSHAVRALGEYEQQEFQATVASSINDAIAAGADASPEGLQRTGEQLRFLETTIARHGARVGLAPAAQAQFRDETAAKVHAGIVSQMLAQPGKEQLAKAYFEETRDAIAAGDAPAAARLQEAVNKGVTLGQAQKASDAILATATTPAEARAAAKAIEDPERRQATLELVEHELTVKEREQREGHEALVQKGINIAERTGKWQSIPPTEWAEYDVGERSAIKHYLEAKAGGTTVVSDPNVYAALIGMASSGNPDAVTAFQQLSPATLLDKLSPSDYQEIVKLQASSRKGEAAGRNALLVNAAAQTSMVNEALGAMGFSPNPIEPGKKDHDPVQYARINQFRRSVREAAARVEQQSGKPATDEQLQSIVDQLRTRTGKRVIKDGWVWDTHADAYAFEEAQAQADTVDDVPVSERRRIEDALRAEKVPVTPDAVLRFFNLRLSHTRKDR